MNIRTNSRRGFALLLAAVLLLALAPLAAQADTTYNSLSMTTGETKSNIQMYNVGTTSSFGNITSVVPSDSNIVRATVASDKKSFSLYAVTNGQTNVTVYWQDSVTAIAHTEIMTVTVGSTNNTTGTSVSVAAGSTVTASGYYYQIYSAFSQNSSVATVTQNGSTGNQTLSVTGVASGSTNILVQYYASAAAAATGTSALSNAVVPVTVSGNYTGTGTTNNNATYSTPYSLEAGKTASIDSITVATNIVSSNPTVGTAAIENGKMVLRGLSAGTTDITFNGGSSANATTAYKITLTVTGTASGSSANGGLTFSKSSTSVASGKNYRLKGMKSGGTSMSAAELRWMSSDTDVLTVNAKTGVFKGKTSGEAYLVAVDPSTGAVGSIKIEVK